MVVKAKRLPRLGLDQDIVFVTKCFDRKGPSGLVYPEETTSLHRHNNEENHSRKPPFLDRFAIFDTDLKFKGQ